MSARAAAEATASRSASPPRVLPAANDSDVDREGVDRDSIDGTAGSGRRKGASALVAVSGAGRAHILRGQASALDRAWDWTAAASALDMTLDEAGDCIIVIASSAAAARRLRGLGGSLSAAAAAAGGGGAEGAALPPLARVAASMQVVTCETACLQRGSSRSRMPSTTERRMQLRWEGRWVGVKHERGTKEDALTWACAARRRHPPRGPRRRRCGRAGRGSPAIRRKLVCV